MFLIVGLGNPGTQYEKTRHNAGFMAVDELIKRLKFPEFVESKKCKSLISEGIYERKKLLIVKPQTYMNKSGEAVSATVHFYKIPLSNLLLIYDDIDLELGTIRFREKGSAGTHNGMRSVIDSLGSEKFPRMRIGIETRGKQAPLQQDVSSFVLSPFGKQEKLLIEKALKECVHKIIQLI